MVDQESARPIAKSAAAKAKHTPAPRYEKVARAITGDDPPARLVKFLKKWGPCLAVDRGVAAVKLPTRAHMRKTLEGVRRRRLRAMPAWLTPWRLGAFLLRRVSRTPDPAPWRRRASIYTP